MINPRFFHLSRRHLYIPLTLAIALFAGCTSNSKQENLPVKDNYTSTVAQLPEEHIITPKQDPQIDLEKLVLKDVNVIARNINPQSRKYIALVLESHTRYDDGAINPESLRQQPLLYDAGTQLIEGGFRNIFVESVMHQMSLETLLEGFVTLNPSVDFGELQRAKSPNEAKQITRSKYVAKGLETSWLLALTYPGRATFKGAESEESLLRQMEYSDMLLRVQDVVNSGMWDHMRTRYKRNKNNEEAKDFLLEFNMTIDYVKRNYDWFMNGRSREMVDTVLTRGNGVLFVGPNHFQSISRYLSSKGINYVIFCANCKPDDVVKFEQKFREIINSLGKYKVKL